MISSVSSACSSHNDRGQRSLPISKAITFYSFGIIIGSEQLNCTESSHLNRAPLLCWRWSDLMTSEWAKMEMMISWWWSAPSKLGTQFLIGRPFTANSQPPKAARHHDRVLIPCPPPFTLIQAKQWKTRMTWTQFVVFSEYKTHSESLAGNYLWLLAVMLWIPCGGGSNHAELWLVVSE